MGDIPVQYRHLFFVFLGMFLTGGPVLIFVFWTQIYPVFERLGHDYDPWTGKYKDPLTGKHTNGFFKTLYEYKRFVISEKKTLLSWWAFWASLWTTLLAWGGVGVIILLSG